MAYRAPPPPGHGTRRGVAPRNCQQKKARALGRGPGGGGSCARGKQEGGWEGQAVQLEGRDQNGADDLARQGGGVEGGLPVNFLFPAPSARSERRGGGSHRGSRGAHARPSASRSLTGGAGIARQTGPFVFFLFLLFFSFPASFSGSLFPPQGGGGLKLAFALGGSGPWLGSWVRV